MQYTYHFMWEIKTESLPQKGQYYSKKKIISISVDIRKWEVKFYFKVIYITFVLI